MVLAGSINKRLVALLQRSGLDGLGISGVDGAILRARSQSDESIDLGLVGEITSVNAGLLQRLLVLGCIPVIAPIALGSEGEIYNINADHAAAAVAGALEAEMLIYMSDIEGVIVDQEVTGQISYSRALELIASGGIHGGMVPKIRSALRALDAGVRHVRIVDGRSPEILQQVLRGDPVGTGIVGSQETREGWGDCGWRADGRCVG